jgi:hypothetical protein
VRAGMRRPGNETALACGSCMRRPGHGVHLRQLAGSRSEGHGSELGLAESSGARSGMLRACGGKVGDPRGEYSGNGCRTQGGTAAAPPLVVCDDCGRCRVGCVQ